jgi:hypothetical protein
LSAQVSPGSDRGHGTDLSTVESAVVERDLDVHLRAVVVIGRRELERLEEAAEFGCGRFGQLLGD